MRFTRRSRSPSQGYGNLYTPHAGSLVIQLQREGGLANRTITVSPRRLRLLRAAAIIGGTILAAGIASWVVLAAQAARVPTLTRRVTKLQQSAERVDTLQTALLELERRFQQVQRMLGAAVPALADSAAALAPVAPSTEPSQLTAWPLSIRGRVLTGALPAGASPPRAIDIAVPTGTPVRSAGAGTVIEVREPALGDGLIRIQHANGYATSYENVTDALVELGDQVEAGAAIALSGPANDIAVPHLRFGITRNGKPLDPSTLMIQESKRGDLQ